MKCHRLSSVLPIALAMAAVATPAVALPPSHEAAPQPAHIPVIEGEAVADSELAAISGKYFGANMLVGLRVDLVSSLANGQGGAGKAVGSLYIARTAEGFDIRVHSQADASGTSSAAPGAGTMVSGGDQIQVNGIGQITQVAGDGNRMANIAVIGVTDNLAAPEGFNGRTSAQADSGGISARVTFADGGLRLGLAAGGATISQAMSPANGGQITQIGQIAGNGFAASNNMHLQLMTATMSSLSAQQIGIQQALAAVNGLGP